MALLLLIHFHIVLNLYFELSLDLCIISQIFSFIKIVAHLQNKQNQNKQTNNTVNKHQPAYHQTYKFGLIFSICFQFLSGLTIYFSQK